MDAKLKNDKGVMIRMLKVERRVLTWSLHTVPMVHDLFSSHRLGGWQGVWGPIVRRLCEISMLHT